MDYHIVIQVEAMINFKRKVGFLNSLRNFLK